MARPLWAAASVLALMHAAAADGPFAAPVFVSRLRRIMEELKLPEGNGGGAPPPWVGPDLASARQLQDSNRCSPASLSIMPPPRYNAYKSCLEWRMNVTNDTEARRPGAYFDMQGRCWCENNMTSLFRDIGCDKTRNWQWLCDLHCTDDCSSDKVQACLKSCPATCFEQDYVTESCRCTGCYEHLLCITQKAKTDLDPMCDETALDASPEFQAYSACEEVYSTRTAWNRYNVVHHCACSANISSALRKHSCCAANWAKPLCASNCSTDCGSASARNCAEQCASLCPMITLSEVDSACHNIVDSCDEYKVCRPSSTPPAFNYICDDGTKPGDDGCCLFTSVTSTGSNRACPKLCTMRRAYIVGGDLQCLCEGKCPRTLAEVSQVLNDAVLGNVSIWQSGQQSLIDIAMQVGLPLGASSLMQAMMVQRNAEIQRAIDAHVGPFNAALEQQIVDISNKWNKLIMEEALLYKSCLSNPGQRRCAVYTTTSPTPDAVSNSTVIIVLVVVGVLAVLILGGILVMLAKIRMKRMEAHEGGDISPQSGDTNVVVGRPVEGMGPVSFGQASRGAPVAVVAPARKGDV